MESIGKHVKTFVMPVISKLLHEMSSSCVRSYDFSKDTASALAAVCMSSESTLGLVISLGNTLLARFCSLAAANMISQSD